MLPPVTTPPELTDAMGMDALLHVPPDVPSVNEIVDPTQTTFVVTVMGSGDTLTASVVVE